MFKSAKVGDRVWSFRWGWGKINNIVVGDDDGFPICVIFTNKDIMATYTIDGKFRNNEAQDLFWDEITFEAPPKPKQKMKKWISFFAGENGQLYVGGTGMCPNLYDTKEEAVASNMVGLYERFFVEIEYEI